jgi:aspartyl-tRNA(Asn)/glutamyl-tRNA(Gln) amidotransferase subunit B
VSDTGALEAEIDKIVAASPDEVARFKAGNNKLMGFFVGQVMKATQGKANPKLVNQILAQKLGKANK